MNAQLLEWFSHNFHFKPKIYLQIGFWRENSRQLFRYINSHYKCSPKLQWNYLAKIVFTAKFSFFEHVQSITYLKFVISWSIRLFAHMFVFQHFFNLVVFYPYGSFATQTSFGVIIFTSKTQESFLGQVFVVVVAVNENKN